LKSRFSSAFLSASVGGGRIVTGLPFTTMIQRAGAASRVMKLPRWRKRMCAQIDLEQCLGVDHRHVANVPKQNSREHNRTSASRRRPARNFQNPVFDENGLSRAGHTGPVPFWAARDLKSNYDTPPAADLSIKQGVGFRELFLAPRSLRLLTAKWRARSTPRARERPSAEFIGCDEECLLNLDSGPLCRRSLPRPGARAVGAHIGISVTPGLKPSDAHMERVAGKTVTVRPGVSAELRVGAKPGPVLDELGL
jgi:hypothetical protein